MQQQPTLTQSLDQYLQSLAGHNLSHHTTTAYATDIRQFLTWLTEQDVTITLPTHLTKSSIHEYLSSLASLGRTGVTRARKLAALREYCKYLVERGLISRSPTEGIKMPKKEKRSRVFLRVDEYLRLLTAAGGNSRDFAILQLFLQTGIRVSELTGLLLTDIDLGNETITIHGKGKKERLMYLEKKGAQALKSYLKVRPQTIDPHVFLNYEEKGISVRGVSDIVEKYRRLAGIQKRISCHSLRHTFATYKASMGVTAFQLQELLGHDQISTSLLYVHMAMTDPKKLMQQTSL